MIRLASVIDTFGADFLAQHRQRLRPEHTQALAAMKRCRTSASPKMQANCTQCSHHTLVPHSCGHRHCPHCQHHDSQQWIERQLAKQVPAQYFLLTFTLPAQCRALAAAHPGIVYDLLLRCAWDTVRTFSQNDRQLQGVPGAIAVLHTNTRALDYHPHVHLVMPAAALDAKHRQWRTKGDGQAKTGLSVQPHGAGQGLPGQDARGHRGRRAEPARWLSAPVGGPLQVGGHGQARRSSIWAAIGIAA